MRAILFFASLCMITSLLLDQFLQSEDALAQPAKPASNGIFLASSDGDVTVVPELVRHSKSHKTSIWGNYLAGLHALTHRDLSNAGQFFDKSLGRRSNQYIINAQNLLNLCQ